MIKHIIIKFKYLDTHIFYLLALNNQLYLFLYLISIILGLLQEFSTQFSFTIS